jgi:putative flippase GtrA
VGAVKLARTALSPFVSRQFGVYLLAGLVPTVANFAAGALVRLVSTSALVYGASVVVGYVVGTVVSFFLHRRYTFAVGDEPAAPQAVRFAVVSVGAVVLGLAFAEGVLALWQLAGSPWLSRAAAEALVHVATIGVNTVYGFLAMKFFALKRRTRSPAPSPG